jgi:WbqC-like protein family
MKVAVHQHNYIPWPGYFAKIIAADVFVFYDDVQFEKGGYTNRVEIRGNIGARWLTQPVSKHGILLMPLRNVLFANPAWRETHKSVLWFQYRRAPRFADLEPLLETLYSRSCEDLASWNATATEELCRHLGLEGKRFVRSSTLVYDRSGSASEKLASLCRALGAETYVSGRGAANYNDVEAFAAAGIGLEYVQVPAADHPEWSGFMPRLSALDAIAMIGVDGLRQRLGVCVSH